MIKGRTMKIKITLVFIGLLLILSPGSVESKPGPIPIAGGVSFGIAGEMQCKNCRQLKPTLPVRLTNYDPHKGDINCFDFDEDLNYCMSHTASLIPWESVWGLSAACPQEWPIGTWVVIPEVSSFICMDRGGMVTCDDELGYCSVDILGPFESEWWNGYRFDVDKVLLWVPIKPFQGPNLTH